MTEFQVNDDYDHLISDEKNKLTVFCTKCPSKILSSTTGKHTKIEFNLPHMSQKKDSESVECELLSDYWLVPDMYMFENIGFSKLVESGFKYLICADCEIGPIGWYDDKTKYSYIALSRVKHSD
ncbi:guanine nucleotide exchange factor MSS4 homolog [Daktulosphaira vitifoliae]|uniref:guanine nucleotide exchange factor MSS4 homolog n=1 Tax=Daktulosphaira vitifoliae TaxID=58002 RepID=UPI0021AAE7E9|nr:guanine nucleotide exchange factor MSS4 homolog [Daktulosphaira vitifoliae]